MAKLGLHPSLWWWWLCFLSLSLSLSIALAIQMEPLSGIEPNDCALIDCPKIPADGLECPDDSYSDADYGFQLDPLNHERSKRDLNSQSSELFERCCPESHCSCNKCPQRPRCKSGQVLLQLTQGTGKPGSCCSQYACGAKPSCVAGGEMIYWLDSCTKCNSCEPLCTSVCNQADSPPSNCLSDDLLFKMNGESWTESDGCEICTCLEGSKHCQISFCEEPICDKYIKVEGKCCRQCAEPAEEPPLLIPDEYTKAPAISVSVTTEGAIVHSTPTTSSGAVAEISIDTVQRVEVPVEHTVDHNMTLEKPVELQAGTTISTNSGNSTSEAPEAAAKPTMNTLKGAPDEAPVEAPVEALVEAPVEAPVEVPMGTPVKATAEATVEALNATFVPVPVEEPDTTTVLALIGASEAIPVEASDAAPVVASDAAPVVPSNADPIKPLVEASDATPVRVADADLSVTSKADPGDIPIAQIEASDVTPIVASNADLDAASVVVTVAAPVNASDAAPSGVASNDSIEDHTETTEIADSTEVTELPTELLESKETEATERNVEEIAMDQHQIAYGIHSSSTETAKLETTTENSQELDSTGVVTDPPEDGNAEQQAVDSVEHTTLSELDSMEISSTSASNKISSSLDVSTSEHPNLLATAGPAAQTPESTSWHRDATIDDADYRFANENHNDTVHPPNNKNLQMIIIVSSITAAILVLLLSLYLKKRHSLYSSVPHSDTNLSENTNVSDLVICMESPYQLNKENIPQKKQPLE